MPAVALAPGRAPHGPERDALDGERGAGSPAGGGLKLGVPGRAAFAGRVRELTEGDARVTTLVEPLLAILATMLDQLAHLTKQVQSST